MDSTRTLLNQFMESTKYKLLCTLGNCGAEHKNEVAEVSRDIADPSSAIGTEYLLTSYVKKNFEYVEFTEVPLYCAEKNKDLVGLLSKKKRVSSVYRFWKIPNSSLVINELPQ